LHATNIIRTSCYPQGILKKSKPTD